MTAEAIDVATPLERLSRKAARQRVDERDLERAIYQAQQAGHTHRQISDIVGTCSQATVQRILRRITEDPALLEETPAEIIDRRAAGMIGSEEMMAKLLDWKYSFGGVVRVDDVATDAYTTGDWDSIEMAYYRDLLSEDEFQELAERHLKSI
ncbi:Uncharacterised protein [Mycobacteroides abscessus subsp. abscessus]|uniref:helix-turn-helix domain-containing protein n=1 Tax=Mycobacteroides abscessus TaxID=36809 RepID=UPI00092C1C16|nr:helix-turn-helix domain-containing protein [Mycobacteroides abscessus]SIH25741.1 Uncharacterised protein [Mycobacteroides abscessus subsp. abscessus]